MKPITTLPDLRSRLKDYRDLPECQTPIPVVCKRCGTEDKYMLGLLSISPEKTSPHRAPKGAVMAEALGFTRYITCTHCGSDGPWDFPPEAVRIVEDLMIFDLENKPETPSVHLVEKILNDNRSFLTTAEGVAHLKRRIAADPTNYYLWNRLGNLYLGGAAHQLAFAAWSEAIKLNPKDVESHFSIAMRHYGTFDLQPEKAVEHLKLSLHASRNWQPVGPEVNREQLVFTVLTDLWELHEKYGVGKPLPPFDPLLECTPKVPPETLDARGMNCSTPNGRFVLSILYIDGTRLESVLALQILPDRGAEPRQRPVSRAQERVGRNEPCPCGSGRKFKNCCMR